MAKYQYRICSELDWMSASGNAILAISNPLGSGKKLVIKDFELTPLTSSNTASAGSVSAAAATVLSLARVTVAGGIPVTPVKSDTDASAFPATVSITRRATVSGTPEVVRRVFVNKQLIATSLSWLAKLNPYSEVSSGIYKMPRRDAVVEGIVVREGEGLALYASTLNNSVPVRVSVVVSVSGSPNRSFVFRYFTNIIGQDEAIFAIENTASSGEVVTLRSISVQEVGTFDTPYLQLVPVGSIIDGDNSTSVSVLKMDTDYPDPSSWVQVKQDASILPYGMPENALADSSAGSPKGFNYLKTKDFLGPVFRTVFPEYIAHRPGSSVEIGASWQGLKWKRTGINRGEITIREGEGIALVSGAETAAGATTAVTVSGWSSFQFAFQVSVEPKLSPTLTVTGLKNPSEVRIYNAGTTTLLAGQENVTTGTFSWQFDPDSYPSVDIAILALGYQNIRFPEFALSLADVSIPIQQQTDRQYLNP